jgi:hypothetical protein
MPAIRAARGLLKRMFTSKAQGLPRVGRFSGQIAPGAAEEPLHQLTMLVTADGRCVLPDSEEFFAALGDPDPDYDATGFAVRNLGFVKFQVLDRLVTEIELHPRNVDLRALLAVERLIGEAGTNLFRIRHLENEWQSEISASAEHTLARLRELCAPVFDPPDVERFRVEPRDPAILFDGPSRRVKGLGPMAMKWRVAFGNFDSNVLEIASRNDLLSLTAIMEFDRHTSTPVWRFLGDGHRWAGRQYQVNGIGDRVEDMPDKEYGSWVAEFHRAVAVSGQPRYDLVTANMQMIDDRGRPRQTVSYERLLLPWRTPSGEVLITSCATKVSGARVANLVPDTSDSSVVK